MMREPTLIIAMLPSLALVIDVDHCVSGLLVLLAVLDQYYPVHLKTVLSLVRYACNLQQ